MQEQPMALVPQPMLIASTAAAVLALSLSAQTTTAPDAGVLPPTPPAPPRPTLVREGSFLVAARGTMERDEPPGLWRFRLEKDDTRLGPASMPLLPCSLLASLEQIIEGGGETVFEMTAEVFVYRGENYLLPTHAPLVASYAPPHDGPEPAVVADQTERPEDIIRRMEREIGPVPRLPAAALSSGNGKDRLVREGSLVTWRRGWMTREPAGTWVFTFAADADGQQEDPPMVLMPCLLLERMERQLEQGGRRRVLLVSGRVFRYGRRNYLLPTAFQVPRERTPLQP
jgi:hypothetical protein